jgi:hypothetical protein
LRLFGVDIYVEPRTETVSDKDLRYERHCRKDVPFLVLFIPLSLPALRDLIKMSANASQPASPINNKTYTMPVIFMLDFSPWEEEGQEEERNQPLELVCREPDSEKERPRLRSEVKRKVKRNVVKAECADLCSCSRADPRRGDM